MRPTATLLSVEMKQMSAGQGGWLGTQDSNLDLRSQSPLSYH